MGEVEEQDVRNLRNMPSYLVGAGDGGAAFEKSVGELGFDNCSRVDAATPAEVWTWLSEHPAHPVPVPTSPSCRWRRSPRPHTGSRCGGFDLEENPSVDARVDRDANTITIDAKAISNVEVQFNDLMLDLSAPVKVVVNGVVHEELIVRNKRTMIDMVFNQGDWARIFCHSRLLEVTAASDGWSRRARGPGPPALSPRVKIPLVLLVAAIGGAGTMIVELAAVRLLGPWFGTSLVVWTNVIAVVLLALALGYLLGGRLSNRGRTARQAGFRPDPRGGP